MRTTFRFARIRENSDWLLPIAICVLLLVWVRFSYQRDARELKPWQCRLLIVLRSLVFFGLLLFYLQPQFEIDREVVTDSRVALIVDTSSSMGSRDEQFSDNNRANSPNPGTEQEKGSDHSPSEETTSVTRLERMIDWLGRSDLVEQLRRKHDVAVYTFDQELEFVGMRAKRKPGESSEEESLSLNNWAEPSPESDAADSPDEAEDDTSHASPLPPDWFLKLEAKGAQTRLGEMLLKTIEREHRHPISGLVVMTDGGQNAGPGPEEAIASALGSGMAVHTVGFGAAEALMNVRVAHLDAPGRAFPEDPFSVHAQIELTGSLTKEGTNGEGRPGESRKWTVPVELRMRKVQPEGASSEGGETEETLPDVEERLIETKEVELDEENNVAKIRFEVTPAEKGPQVLIVRAHSPDEDNAKSDDRLERDIEIVDRRDRILIFAGGPSRDYRFLRGQLYRDPSMEIDLYLPWSQVGISQEADNLLDHFPRTRAEMFEYDCLVAFDPDWNALAPEQIRLLEEWVARQAGGMIVEAGPVYMGDHISGWVANPEMKIIRSLYPVRLFDRTSLWEHTFSADDQPWPLEFSPAGRQADYLRLAESAAESLANWSRFPGVYSYQSVQGVKPAATLLAQSTSPDASRQREAVYFAEHFYGSGRVFYIGSGELWRLRQIDPDLFEQLFVKLIRHVSQGRLLRESDRGTLATDRRWYPLGATATIRATLSDVDLQPLTDAEVVLEVITPEGTARTTSLSPDANVAGNYLGYLPLREEGTWRLRLTLPESDQQITRTLRVRMPDLERENSARNDALLSEIARRTGGKFFPSPEAALYPRSFETDLSENSDPGADSEKELPALLPDQTRTTLQPAPPDKEFQRWSMMLLLWVLCGLVLVEWLLRRILKLA